MDKYQERINGMIRDADFFFDAVQTAGNEAMRNVGYGRVYELIPGITVRYDLLDHGPENVNYYDQYAPDPDEYGEPVDLSKLDDVVGRMNEIISLDMPFTRMNELANLVFQASSAKDEILKNKLEATKKRIETDRDMVARELSDAMGGNLTDEQKNRIQEKADSVSSQYEDWLGMLTSQTANMDSYVTASANNLSGFKQFIASVMNEGNDRPVRTKRVRIIDYVPTVNKKITSAQDVDKVLDTIREKLLAELENNDEIDLG